MREAGCHYRGMSRLHQAHHKYILDDTSTCDALTSEKITFITLLCLLEICRCIRWLQRTWGVEELLNSHLFSINFFYYFKILCFFFPLNIRYQYSDVSRLSLFTAVLRINLTCLTACSRLCFASKMWLLQIDLINIQASHSAYFSERASLQKKKKKKKIALEKYYQKIRVQYKFSIQQSVPVNHDCVQNITFLQSQFVL